MSNPSSLDRAQSPVLLRDYRAPAWRVTDVDLEFDLDPAATIVTAQLTVEQDLAQAGSALALDAEDIDLLEVRVDGRVLDAGEYRFSANTLTIPHVRGRAVIGTRVRIAPEHNTALQGLYLSGSRDSGFLLTQCEAEGFRRITPFIDRPDVLARYSVTLRADRSRFPVLLANGNAEGGGDLGDGRHWARFVDPHPKPSYLFALVAGRLERIENTFVTAEGRRVRLVIHAEADAIARCGWAMQCLKMAMQWDEERFGRCYDLDVFHIVATHDFTMGAMENKGLNIFNAKYLLADPEHATDDDYRHVLAVIGHEYFHNWSGNRVTCRDWFQLSLKEGLTVYREQEFASDLASRTLRRIEDVRALWRAQFAEDAGPLAHPVRPDRYSEINNFYTATVYEKGAEIVRMLATVLGRDGFRRGLDLYFERHDGSAVTVEDFLRALGDANERDLSPWLAWYSQAGTPELRAEGSYDTGTRCYELTLAQQTSPTPQQPHKRALPIPVNVMLLDAEGRSVPIRLDGDAGPRGNEHTLLLQNDATVFRFADIDTAPVVSLLRSYSAPVRLRQDTADATLAVQVQYDSDGFNRWFAADTLARRLFARTLERGELDSDVVATWTDALGAAVPDTDLGAALVAELLTIADANSLTDGLTGIDPDRVHRVRSHLENGLASALEAVLLQRYRDLSGDDALVTDFPAQERRKLRNRCLALLCRANTQHVDLARAQFANAANLTDRLAALAAWVNSDASDVSVALGNFAARYANDALVLDKWFAVQAAVPRTDTVERVKALLVHPAFRWTNPNKVYALLGAFAMGNPLAFHRIDGAGYRLLADSIIKLDGITPQVAARLATAFGRWGDYEPVRRGLMQRELERLDAHESLSRDVADIVARSLAA